MGSILCPVVALIFLLIAFWWLDRHRWAQLITRPVKRYSWVLTKGMLKLVWKLLRKVTSLFDPY